MLTQDQRFGVSAYLADPTYLVSLALHCPHLGYTNSAQAVYSFLVNEKLAALQL